MSSPVDNKMSASCRSMIGRLAKLTYSCQESGETAPHMPIMLVDDHALAGTKYASEVPEHTGYYSLPLENQDGSQPAFGYLPAVVDVFPDGTAIAKTREWKYGYRVGEPTLDGKPREVSSNSQDNHMVVRHYLLGCQHTYAIRNDLAADLGHQLFNHDHLYHCRKCGHTYVVDSSD